MSDRLSFGDLQGRRALIWGDTRKGITCLTVQLLKEVVQLGLSDEITVIDLAPSTQEVKEGSLGGRLSEYTNITGFTYLVPSVVYSPRLTGETHQQVEFLVDVNRENIEPLIEYYLENPTPILFVNDCSIILQAGESETLLSALENADTFIANGYYGETLPGDKGTGVSRREKALMEKLASRMDFVLEL